MLCLHQASDGIGYIDRIARSADLIVHHTQELPFACQAQHRFNEIPTFAAAAPDAIKATGTNDEMPRAIRSNQEFPGQLAHAINVDRTRPVAFLIRLRTSGIEAEDVIGTELDQRAAEIPAG